MKKNWIKWIDTLIAFIISFTVMIFLYKVYGFAPFGDKSFACMDANIQYLDFFAYFKDVLTGKNHIWYTFSKSLGGSNIGTYSYYLASPFNLLVLFFEKKDLHDFFDLIVALKMAAASVSFCVFLHKRFQGCWETWYKRELAILLSISYALCQYNIAQSSNIMWLDGVYMLPLILWGVYDVVYHHSGWKLSLFTGLSILFGWYSAGINCLFSGIWFFFELSLKLCDQSKMQVPRKSKRQKISKTPKHIGKCLRQYIFAMAVGILNSAVVFWPTIEAMKNASKGGFDLARLADFSLIGEISSVIPGYSLGARSSYGAVSLFCGSLGLIGCLSCFISKGFSSKKKTIFGIMAGVTLMTFYWNPLYMLFSLLKNVGSYWYRHSYVGIFAILFLTAYFCSQKDLKKDTLSICKSGIVFAACLLLWNYWGKVQNTKWIYYTAAFFFFGGIFWSLSLYSLEKYRKGSRIMWGITGVIVISELTLGAKLQMDNYHTSDVSVYKEYVKNTEQQIKYINESDPGGMHRISQTTTRNHNRNINQTANYNEAMAYGYASLTTYTSSPDDRPMMFLDRMGYHWEGVCMTIANTSIVGADSLVGVKYILSDHPINGLEEVAKSESIGDKKIFRNPYYLPLALPYGMSVYQADTNNPFEYQNMLYSQLMEKKVEIYKPLNFSLEKDENDMLVYSISIPSGNYAVYGNMPWYRDTGALVNVNDIYEMSYTTWLSPHVFYIPTVMNSENRTAWIKIPASNYDGFYQGAEQFYGLDLDILGGVSETLRAKAERVTVSEIKDGKALFEVEASEGECLYVSIPYDRGWKITNNGKPTSVYLFGDCMYSVPLKEGKNVIKMRYYLPGIWAGIIGSCIGILLTLKEFRMAKNEMGITAKEVGSVKLKRD